MFELDVEREFSAAHNLRGYNGQCAQKHGHNWTVQIHIRASRLDELGMAMDFKLLKKELDSILARLDHHDLNEVPPFDKLNPTSENLAKFFFDSLSAVLNNGNIKVSRVRICENRSSGAAYFEE